MNDLEVITRLCGLKNESAPTQVILVLLGQTLNSFLKKKQTVAVQRAAQTNSCNLNTL